MKIISLIFIITLAIIIISPTLSQAEWVRGYYRKSGTYVSPYYRSDRGTATGYGKTISPSYYSTYDRQYDYGTYNPAGYKRGSSTSYTDYSSDYYSY